MDRSRYVKTPASELRMGMYVVELDRPWIESPFLVQGFVVKTVEELEVITDLCRFVYVDTGLSVKHHKPTTLRKPGERALTKDKLEAMFAVRVKSYDDTTDFENELIGAKKVYADYENTVRRLYDNFSTNQKIDLHEVKQSVSHIVDSIIRNPDACTLLAKLKKKGDYNYNHAIGASVWAATLGRQLGLPKMTITSLSTGALLADVGKLQLSDRLLNKNSKLTREEYELMTTHVKHGLRMLQNSSVKDSIVLQMIENHHERHNGTGYPLKHSGTDIPVYGRIAGLVDSYDALISDKPYRKGLPPSEAVKELYKTRDIDFQAALVEELIQAVGVYPSGSMVELSSGEVGIVIAEHRRRRLRPKLLLILDKNKAPINEKRYLDLFINTHDAEGNPIEISKSLVSGDYGIDLDSLLI